MQVIITAINDIEGDGVDGEMSMTRNIEDLQGLSQLYADAARAMGFTYVEDVGFEKDDGEMTFGVSW